MRVITRILSGIILLLAIAQGALLVATVQEDATNLRGQVSTLNVNRQQPIRRRGDSALQRALLRLPMVPQLTGKRLLVAVIVENHEDARPYQEGLGSALLIEEWFVEGFISRFVAIYDVHALPSRAGPVRSLRPYFLDGLLPWSLPIFHAGGSPEALARVFKSTVHRSINGLAGAYYSLYEREEKSVPPHDLFVSRKTISKIFKEGNYTSAHWPPYKEGGIGSGEDAVKINLNFSNPLHNVEYTYRPSTKRYTRRNGTVVQDAEPSNVLVLEMPIDDIGAYGRLHIQTLGRGRALLFRAGRMYEGHWNNEGDNKWFSFTDSEGNPLKFARGQTWMTVLQTLDRVRWDNDIEDEG